MASTTFIDYSNATPITAAWLNDVNRLQYTILGNPITSADINNVLGIVNAAHAGGTADALTATYTTPPTAFVDGLVYYVRAASANATTTPTFTPNSGVLAATAIVKGDGQALLIGDISGAGHWLALQYDTTLTKWILLNPARGVTPVIGQIPPITATVAANALTLGLNPTITFDFRSTTLTTGIPNTRRVTSALSLVVPAGATLGCLNASAQYTTDRLLLLAIDNAGTVELAIINIAGGNNLDEASLLTTTTISAGATSSNVAYSTTGRTNVPFKVIGEIVLPAQVTAGTWVLGPTLVQGLSEHSFAAMSTIGIGQTWQTPARVAGTTCYNTTSRPIQLEIQGNATGAVLTVGGVVLSGAAAFNSVTAIVPPGVGYSCTNFTTFAELR